GSFRKAITVLICSLEPYCNCRELPSFPTRRSSDLPPTEHLRPALQQLAVVHGHGDAAPERVRVLVDGREARREQHAGGVEARHRSEEHTSELQSRENLVCRLLLEKKNNNLYSLSTS